MRRTTSRRQLASNPRFEQISPEVGQLDESAVDDALRDDPDATLALLAEMTGATDRRLSDLARRLAARLFLDLARRGPARRGGVGRLAAQPYRPDGGDLDLDASFEAIAEAEAGGAAVDVERLRIRSWTTPQTAICLVVDRSGSMGGGPLATAAIAAAAVASRNPADYSVLAFSNDVVALKSQDAPKAAERVVTDLLVLRGHGTTDLARALRAAADQLARSRAARKITVLLSDCRSTVEGDAHGAASRLSELAVIAPRSDCEEAVRFTDECGARLALVDGPSGIVAAVTAALER
jgi:Mg-chelatase subunit ChlD